jgi:hypothetical protein
MPFDWRFRNFKRDPEPFLNGAVIDAENARNNLVQNAGNDMEGYTPLESTLAAQAMEGYKPVVPATQSQLAAGASQAMQGYTPNSAGRPSVPNDMHGGMGQPDLEGYGESLQAASDAAAQAQAKEQQIADIESQISALEKRIAENTAKLQNFAGNADQIAAIEARKINSADPTAIWRWKVDRDEAKRIANAQNKPNDTARANALIDANNTLDSMIINDSLDTPTKNAMLSKLADVKSSLEKNGFDTSRVNSMISKLKGNGEQTTREQAKTDWKGLKGKPDLTSNEIQTALDNPDMNWDPDERKEAENLRDKLKKHEAATQDVKNMKNWLSTNYGINYSQLDADEQKSWQEIWKAQK